MRRLIALLCCVLFVAATPLAAQSPIHRCVGANGNPVFTDQPCAALNATPLAPAAPSVHQSTGASAPAILCAANIDELKRAVIEAFADHDANRMAGLILWSGYGRSAVVADIQALQRFMREPLLDLGLVPADDPAPTTSAASADPFAMFDGTAPIAAPPPATADSDILVLHTSGDADDGQPRAMRFSVVRRAGCAWLRNAE